VASISDGNSGAWNFHRKAVKGFATFFEKIGLAVKAPTAPVRLSPTRNPEAPFFLHADELYLYSLIFHIFKYRFFVTYQFVFRIIVAYKWRESVAFHSFYKRF
jgi:hypothetical protein